MYYAQLHRPGKGVYADHTEDDIEDDFVFWGGFNEDSDVLLEWVDVVSRPGDTIEVWYGTLYKDLRFETDMEEPYTSFEIPLAN